MANSTYSPKRNQNCVRPSRSTNVELIRTSLFEIPHSKWTIIDGIEQGNPYVSFHHRTEEQTLSLKGTFWKLAKN